MTPLVFPVRFGFAEAISPLLATVRFGFAEAISHPSSSFHG